MTQQHAHIHPFLHSATLIEKRLENMLRPSRIRDRQALVLDALQKGGPSSQQRLAKHFCVSPGTMSSMISRLETLGFVQRETNPTDRRADADVVNITSSGIEALADVADVWQEGNRTIEGILGSEDSKRFFALADQLSRALGGGPPKVEETGSE